MERKGDQTRRKGLYKKTPKKGRKGDDFTPGGSNSQSD